MSSCPTSVDVLLPVRDAGEALAGCLASLAAQDRRGFRVVAVDDGSTDGSGAVLRDWIPARLPGVVLATPGLGVTGALVAACAAAEAPLWARMDADDLAEPDRLRKQGEWMESRPEVVACGTGCTRIDAWGAVIGTWDPPARHEAIEAALLRGDGFALVHPTAMMRAEAVRRAGGYDAAFPLGQDIDLFLRLARLGPLGNVPGRLLRYRQHPANTNFARAAEKRALLLSILERAHRERGLPFDPASLAFRADPGKAADFHRRASRGARRHAGRGAALRHAWRAVRLQPGNADSWRALAGAVAGGRGGDPA